MYIFKTTTVYNTFVTQAQFFKENKNRTSGRKMWTSNLKITHDKKREKEDKKSKQVHRTAKSNVGAANLRSKTSLSKRSLSFFNIGAFLLDLLKLFFTLRTRF